ncbi:MAG: MoxR family ATPase [Candidatus Coatesbacteria bacterium]|nr:MoxR family ATPase [Candidatus Coatesbacteria bacterium]
MQSRDLKADIKIDEESLKTIHESSLKIRNEISKVIIGQNKIIEQLLIALLARGHCLLIGVPGLGKTLLIMTLGKILDLSFNRIQFTPDLMPSDIIGTEIIQEEPETRRRQLVFVKGPVFSSLILADEINRTPPKTQAALLQAMQEYQVTAAGKTYNLPLPFFVLATQNPIEQEGTYPLPEAQLDRFMFSLRLDYPSKADEMKIANKTTSPDEYDLSKIITPRQIIELQNIVRYVPVSEVVVSYAVDIVQSLRPGNPSSPQLVKKYIRWGAGTRACQYLLLASKVKALLDGRATPTRDDIDEFLEPVLSHRIIVNYEAEAEGKDSIDIIREIKKIVKR